MGILIHREKYCGVHIFDLKESARIWPNIRSNVKKFPLVNLNLPNQLSPSPKRVASKTPAGILTFSLMLFSVWLRAYFLFLKQFRDKVYVKPKSQGHESVFV